MNILSDMELGVIWKPVSSPFATKEMAEGYAKARPPLHAHILGRAAQLLEFRSRIPSALDIGCGSGVSTRPLTGLAVQVIGIEPSHMMTARAREAVPSARFITGQAEALPLRPRSIDLITAAGSLNYTLLTEALDEIARVLKANGVLCVYDFSQGRRFRSSPLLKSWFDDFERRYPMPVREALGLSPDILASASPNFSSLVAEQLELALPMTAEQYAAYMMTETNIAAAIRLGTERAQILDWLRNSLALVFRNRHRRSSLLRLCRCLRLRSTR